MTETQKEKLIMSLGLLLAIALSFCVFLYLTKSPENVDAPEPLSGNEKPCPGETKEFVAEDTHMDGLLKLGQKYRLLDNWYACNSLTKGDLVLYRYTSAAKPVVKVVRAVAGDRFSIIQDKKMGAWNIKVNGQLLMDRPSKTPYYFGAKPPSPLSLYEKANRGLIKKGDVILLSNVPPGSSDSGLFGVANKADILGKVEPIE